jgi:pimeloyl-ACP methyl ester carboxylesterase
VLRTLVAARTSSLLAALLAGCLLIAGCSIVDPPGHDKPIPTPTATTSTNASPSGPITTSAPSTQPLSGHGIGKYYHQKVDWADCDSGFLCATISVPLDYDKPDGRSITLSVVKRPADDQKAREGSLLINPGGPGGSGVSYAESADSVFDQTLLDHYDIIGFDPRGVGESTPIECLNDAGLDRLLASDPDPDTPAEVTANEALLKNFGRQCLKHSGALLGHVSTVDAAKDMDILRALVGDAKINYFGASYGTYLGATYANLFPGRVGRMVLDGAVDPALTPRQAGLTQAKGFQTALDAYVDDCIQQPDCPLGRDREAALQRISEFLDQLDRHPLPGDGDRQLTEGLGLLGIILPLYVKDYWPVLTQGLTQAFAGDGSTLLALADAYANRGSNGYKDNSDEVIYAVNCLDHPETVTVAQVRRSIPAYQQAASVFGRVFAWMEYGCSQWPIKPKTQAAPLHARGAAPILVVGTTRDPATPYKEAVALASELDSGVLLSRDGDGHTAYGMGNSCIDNTIDSYLVDDTVPPNGKMC